MIAGAALGAAFGVERTAVGATVVHRAREPVGNERAHDEYCGQDGKAQKSFHLLLILVPQLLMISAAARIAATESLSRACFSMTF